MQSFLSTEEVLTDLKISESTLKNWEKQFHLKKNRGPGNKKRYDDEAMELLRLTKSMRDEDRGFDTIQRVIKEKNTPEVSANAQTNEVASSQPTVTSSEHQQLVPVSSNQEQIMIPVGSNYPVPDTQEFISEVIKAIHEQTEMSERFARATYSIGQLEAEKKALESQVSQLKGEIDSQRSIMSKLKKHWFIRLFWVE